MQQILEQIEILGEFNQEDLNHGYDPIGDAIDNYERINGSDDIEPEDDDEYLNWSMLEEFLYKMIYVEKGHKDYETIFSINYYGNYFLYSREKEDIFREVWRTWDGKNLQGGKCGLWYYYFIDRSIKSYDENLAEIELCEMEAKTTCHILIDDDPDYDSENDHCKHFLNTFWKTN